MRRALSACSARLDPASWSERTSVLGEPEHLHVPLSQASRTTRIAAPLFGTLPFVSLHLPINLSFTVSFIKLVNLNVFLSSVSHSRKVIEPKRGRGNLQSVAGRSEAQVTAWACDQHLEWRVEGSPV